MPEQPRPPKRPCDLNRLAANIVEAATKGEPDPDAGKNAQAVASGRLGGKKGGPARAKKLSAERREKIARNAARARWRTK